MSVATIEPCMASPVRKVPVEWECTTIGQLCNVKRGASPRPISNPKWFGGSTGWVRISDVTQSNKYLRTTVDFLSEEGVSKSVRVNIGEVILTICATIGVPIIVDTDVCIHDGFVWFESLPDRVNREYWYYFLASKTDEFKTYKQTGTQGNLNTAIVGSVEFGLPPLPEQKKIARILSSVDSKLALIDQQITTTQTLKKGLMQKLFTQGVGTQDADGRWQPHTEFQDTELGRVPLGWQCIPFEKAAYLQRGFDLPSQNREVGNIPIISSSGIAGYHNEFQVEGPGVVTGRYGTIGEVFYVEENHWPLNTSLWVKEFFGNHRLFIYYLLQTIDFKKFSEKTGVPGVNRNDIHKLSVSVPPVTEQKEIARILSTVDRKLENLQGQKTQTQQLKKGLMQKLLTGQIRVQPDPQDN